MVVKSGAKIVFLFQEGVFSVSKYCFILSKYWHVVLQIR